MDRTFRFFMPGQTKDSQASGPPASPQSAVAHGATIFSGDGTVDTNAVNPKHVQNRVNVKRKEVKRRSGITGFRGFGGFNPPNICFAIPRSAGYGNVAFLGREVSIPTLNLNVTNARVFLKSTSSITYIDR